MRDPARARALLGSLVEGASGLPAITTAARWRDKPKSFLNLGITHEGLKALGVPAAALASFPLSFQRRQELRQEPGPHPQPRVRLASQSASISSGRRR